MMDLLPFETAHDLGWTLLHFLWQGLFLAALLHTILPLCRGASQRHNCALLTLVLMTLSPVVTFLSLHGSGNGAPMAQAAALVSQTAAFGPGMNTLVLLWLGGVLALSLRAIGGWYLAGSLAHQGTLPVPAELLQRCRALQSRLAVTAPVRFLLSRRVNVPVVVGCLKPVILIPVSALAGLSHQQLDALILHELAHVRRLDTFINILLAAVETLLFYHPAVWWVSRQVRIERENCCDDQAVSACGDAALYVEALTSLESGKPGGMALAATGGKLKDRAARLLDAPAQTSRFSLSAVTGLALLGLLAASIAVAQAPSAKAAAPYPSTDKASVMLRPIQETHGLPPYPTESIHAHEEGRVLLAVTIGTDGAVSRASVFKPSGHERLDAAAVQYVKDHWRWQPAMRAGKPVAANTRVSVLFKLASKPAAPKKL